MNITFQNICIYPILQKYYSALNNLEKLGNQKSIFDDISSLDNFFSEFRNITFVMQKIFNGSDELKDYYNKKRNAILMANQDMKWFIDCRNSTLKEEPFKLEKLIVVDVYLANHSERIYDDRLTTNNDVPFEVILNNLQPTLITYNKTQIDLFFSITLSYQENNIGTNIHEKIISGVQTMHEFILTVVEDFQCVCNKCIHSKKNIYETYQKILLNKKSLFTWDCSFENDKITFGLMGVLMFSQNGGRPMFSDEVRLPLLGSLYYPVESTKNKLINIYHKFMVMHMVIYKAQNLEIMPVFMIIFADDTFYIECYIATIKTTTYRIVSEIAKLIRKQDVVAVLFCGEGYAYNVEHAANILNKKYNERIKSADYTVFSCKMVAKQYPSILTIDVDRSIIKNEELESIIQKNKPKPESSYSFLSPILQSFQA